MKEVRLFEVGFKDNPRDVSYEEKFNVAAENAHEAEEKARAWIVEGHIAWWEEEGEEYEKADRKARGLSTDIPAMGRVRDAQLERLRNLHLAKLYDVGTLIV